jgi:transposase
MMLQARENMPRDPDVLIDIVFEMKHDMENMLNVIKAYKRMLFGAKSEKARTVLGEQACLDLGDLSTVPAPANDDQPAKPPRKKARRNIGGLPLHLPRIDNVIEPDSLDCPCCNGALHCIGADVTEAVDVAPAIIRVIRTIRPKYACRHCSSAIVQAPAPRRLIEGGMATTSLVAWIAASRFGWYIPFYRQAQMLKGQGFTIDRSTMVRWIKQTAAFIRPLYDLQMRHIHSQPRIFCDETRMPVLNPGAGKVHVAQFWAHAVDDRPWNGPAAPAVCYVYARGRNYDAIKGQVIDFSGEMQIDGYTTYKKLALEAERQPGPITLIFCLAHVRRRYVDLHKSTESPVTEQIIRLIGKIYAVEDEVRGTSAAQRLARRQAVSAPLMADLKTLIVDTLAKVSRQSKLAEHIRYTLNHWHGLIRFLDDGRIEVDTNTVERTMRPIALGRRNSLFSGNDGGGETWAILGSMLHTAKLNGHDPYTWLEDVLERMVSGAVKINAIDQLLAWNWQPRDKQPLLALAA